MIDKTAAAEQVLRFSAFVSFGRMSQEGIDELVDAMAQVAQSVRHAAQITDAILADSAWCPSVADIRSTARDTMPDEPTYRRKSYCDQCLGSGYRPVWLNVEWIDGRQQRSRITDAEYRAMRGTLAGIGRQEVYQAVELCPCANGERIRAARIARNQPAPSAASRQRPRDWAAAAANDND